MNTEIETLKQEFEKTQNTFLPKEKLEDRTVTTNVDEWIEFIENYETDPLAPNEYIYDYTIMKNAKAFALGPVFSYMGKAEACSTASYASLADLKNYLKGKKYILYKIFINLKIIKINFENFEPEILKKPQIRYTFRGHILE